jgi:hypothetical protein
VSVSNGRRIKESYHQISQDIFRPLENSHQIQLTENSLRVFSSLNQNSFMNHYDEPSDIPIGSQLSLSEDDSPSHILTCKHENNPESLLRDGNHVSFHDDNKSQPINPLTLDTQLSHDSNCITLHEDEKQIPLQRNDSNNSPLYDPSKHDMVEQVLQIRSKQEFDVLMDYINAGHIKIENLRNERRRLKKLLRSFLSGFERQYGRRPTMKERRSLYGPQYEDFEQVSYNIETVVTMEAYLICMTHYRLCVYGNIWASASIYT